jgi:hypothetical protein
MLKNLICGMYFRFRCDFADSKFNLFDFCKDIKFIQVQNKANLGLGFIHYVIKSVVG